MHSVGILKDNELSESFKTKTIERLKQKGKIGLGNLPIPCKSELESIGVPLGPMDVVPDDLEDKEKYPDFHNAVMNNYKAIALFLDLQGNFSLFPIFDPFALSIKLGIEIPKINILTLPSLTIPQLAFLFKKPVIEMPQILLKLIQIPPQLPPIPEFPPKIDLYLGVSLLTPPFWDRFAFDFWQIKLISVLLQLPDIFLDINFILGLLKPFPPICPIVKLIFEKEVFGPTDPSTETMKIIIVQDLIEFTAEASMITMTGLIVGDGGKNGLVGKLAYDDFDLVDEERESDSSDNLTPARRAIVDATETFMGPRYEFDKNGKAGLQSVGMAGFKSPHNKIDPEATIEGTAEPLVSDTGAVITTCGLLPARIYNYAASFDPDTFGIIGKIKGQGNTGTILAGPQGNFNLARLSRSFRSSSRIIRRVSSKDGQLVISQEDLGNFYKPQPGDLFFLGTSALPITHVGLIWDVEPSPGEPDILVITTAEAGQGLATNQQSCWSKKRYSISLGRLYGTNGEGADLAQGNGWDPNKTGTKVVGFLNLDAFMESVSWTPPPPATISPGTPPGKYPSMWTLQTIGGGKIAEKLGAPFLYQGLFYGSDVMLSDDLISIQGKQPF